MKKMLFAAFLILGAALFLTAWKKGR